MGRCLPLVLAAAALLAPAQTVTVSPSTISGVDLIPPQSPDYWTTVEQLLGAARPGTLNSWLPYGAVLKNGSSQAIVALAIRCEITNASGQIFSSLMENSIFNDRRRQIAPGASIVALPRSVLNGQRLPEEFRAARPAANRELTEIQTARALQMSLDGVVFASGQFAGPDTGQEYEDFQQVVAARPQVASKVLAMKAAGEPTARVLAWLQTVAADRSTRMIRLMGNTARALLRGYEIRGEPALYDYARTESKPAIQLHR